MNVEKLKRLSHVKIRIIGDAHNKMVDLHKIINDAVVGIDQVLCVGDVGFDYTYLKQNINPEYFRFIPGNHDNYDNLPKHSLGDFGVWNDIFFIRGACSIDKEYRIQGVSWWSEEELDVNQSNECLELYSETKPQIVISHDAPEQVVDFLFDTLPGFSMTTKKLLQACFEVHQPKYWFFGHHHKSIGAKIHGTWFQCLDELEYVDIDTEIGGM